MKHARQVIREAVITQLSGITGVTFHRSRAYKLIALPAISVYVDSENISSELKDGINSARVYSREANLIIEVAIEAVDDADDASDDYAAQIEAAIAGDLTLGGTCIDTTLYQTSADIDGSSDKPLAFTRISYRVWYRTTGADPENAIV
jgi:hypothetical protein